MDKIKLEYEETKKGYNLTINGTTNKVKGEENAVQVIEHQIKIIYKIYFHLCEQKEQIIEEIKNDK